MTGVGAGNGASLPDATRLGPVTLQVADVDRSLAFYRDVVGLAARGAPERPALGPAGGAADGDALIELVERPGASPVPPGGRLGLFHVALLLPDRAALGRFARHLAGLPHRVGAADHLVSEAFYLQDPDGLGLEVYADRPRASWPRAGAEIRMGTLPVDVPSLLAEAGEAPWTGAPEGTRVGHVHLQVGDLAAAEDFYRRALGFEVSVSTFPGALFLAAGGYHHHVGLNTWAAGAPVAGEGDARLSHYELVVPRDADVRAVAERLAAHGAPSAPGPRGGVEAVDPLGVRVLVRPEGG